MRARKASSCKLVENLFHDRAHLRGAAQDGRGRERATQPLRWQQHLIQYLCSDREHPTLRAAGEGKAMHVAYRHVHDAHRRERVDTLLKSRFSATSFDKQELM